MDQKRVRELFTLLPPGATYPAVPRRSPSQPARPSAAERFALAMRDPAFAWHFVEAHLKAGKWLPDTIASWPMLQCFLAHWLKVTDPLMLEVESFRTELRRQERNLLEALLLAEDATLAGIAEILNISEEVAEGYAVLFFNVRDRRSEQGYLNSLLHPEGWQAAIRNPKPNAEGDRLRLLRAGAQNDVDEVLALAGYKPGSHTDATTEDSGEVERRMRQDAQRRMRAGCRMEDPVVKAVLQAALRRQETKTDDEPLAIHRMNPFHPVLEELQKYHCIDSPPRPAQDIEQERAEIQSLLRQGAVKPKE